MIPSRRMAVVLLLGLLFLPIGGTFLRAAEEIAKKDDGGVFGLVVDPRAGLQLAAARDYLGDEDWKNAVRLLQHLLDDKADALARLGGRDGKAERYVSVRAEVERMLATMPQAGRDIYRRTNGPRAAELLEQARKDNDAALFAAIARRYLHTESGPAALQALARRHYHAGRLHLAAHGYARLIEHLGLARWTNDDLYHAAAVFQKCGFSAYADRTLKQLLARARLNVVRLGERSLTVEQLRKEIERALPARQGRQWPLFGGDASRAAEASGGAPFLEPIWRHSLIWGEEDYKEGSSIRELLSQTEESLKEHNQLILSALSPISLTLTKGTKKVPLVIYKNYWGVVAFNSQVNETMWAAPSRWSLQTMLAPSDVGRSQYLKDWLSYYSHDKYYPRIVFDNSTLGTISTDGKYIYVVEDFAVPPPPEDQIQGDRRMHSVEQYPADIREALNHNRLQAYSLKAGGKLAREFGGDEKGPLADCYFLAPPLPLDGLLYVLIEKNQRICLLCLDAETFKIVSLQPLLRIASPLSTEPYRRIRAAHLAYREGIIICPTNAGMILGIDLVSGSLAWAYPYRKLASPPAPPPAVVEKTKPPPLPAEPSKRPEIKRLVWTWRGWNMWGSDGFPEAVPVQRRAAAAPKRKWNPRDIPPGWVVGPDGRSVPYLPPLTALDLPFGKKATPPVRDVAAKPAAPRVPNRRRPGRGLPNAEASILPAHPQPYWPASAPHLAGGYVVFTPPDAPSIHCLRLQDGSLAWARPKKAKELYLAGIHGETVLIVSENGVEGVDLASGKTRWERPTGTPSGRGILAEGNYYLPLKDSIGAKRPEILALDASKGQIVSHIRMRPRRPGGTRFDVPGNLLFHEGNLLSVTPWEIVAYPPLKDKIAAIGDQLARAPNDPAALTELGILRLEAGDAGGAVEDLRNALKNKPEMTLHRQIRTQLFEALTVLFQRDLSAAGKYLKNYEEAARVDMEGVSKAERSKRQAERERRRTRYFLLLARFRESQGRVKEALEAYLDLGALGPGDEMLSLPEEPAVKVRRDVWIRSRIAELLRRATPRQRQELEDEMSRHLKKHESRKEGDSLRAYAMLLGIDTAVGREAIQTSVRVQGITLLT